MRNEVKIQFTNQEYRVDLKNGVVKCKVTFIPLYPPFLKFVLKGLNQSLIGPMTVTAKSRVSSSDTFNEETGRKVALAKAESKAYLRIKSVLKDLQEYVKLTDWQISNYSDKADKVVTHNQEFVNKI